MNSFAVSFKGFAKTLYYVFYFQTSFRDVSKKLHHMMGINKNKSFVKFVVSFWFIPNSFGS